jgi:DNA-binding MarR family transcriptional regulator
MRRAGSFLKVEAAGFGINIVIRYKYVRLDCMEAAKISKRQSVAMKNLHALAEFRYYLRGFLNFSEGVAEEAGLHPQQYQLLQVVAAVPEDQLPTIAYVAARLYLRHNSTVELVNRTEQQGMLKREVDASDHRKVLLRLTPRGKELLTNLVERHYAQLKQWAPEMIAVLRKATGDGDGAVRRKRASRA